MMPVASMIVAIVIALTLIASRLYTNTLLSKETEKTMASFDLISATLYGNLEAANEAGLNLLVQNTTVQEYAVSEFPRLVTRVISRIRFRQVMTEFISQHNEILGVLFFRQDGSLFGMIGERVLFYDEPESDPELLEGSISPGSAKAYTPILPLFQSEPWIDRLENPQMIAAGIRRATNTSFSVPMYMLVMVDLNTIYQYLNMESDPDSSVYLISSQGGTILHTSHSGELNDAAWQDIRKKAGGQRVGTLTYKSGKESFYLCYSRINELDWYLVREISINAYEATARGMRLTIWAIAGVLLLLSLILYLSWMKRFTRDFYVLRDGIVRTGHGYLEDTIQQSFRVTEFDEVRRAFNKMNQSLDQLIKTKQKIEREHAETELKNLQMQLSPHMVFNSLTAIRWMATIMGDDKVADMLTELAAMMRPVFREWTMSWTIRQELDHLQHYSRLLDLRFGNHFQLMCQVPEELQELIIPRFTLQPLVENACEHGSVPPDGCLRVNIRAVKENGQVTITVHNNGESMSPETLKEVREILRTGCNKNKVGLHNVYYRLRMCLGQSSAMDVENAPEGGTLVTISWRPGEAEEG